jgi:hypothetical protein
LCSNVWHLLYEQFSQSGQGSYVLIFEHCVANCTKMCITPSWHNVTHVVLTSIQSYVQYMLGTAQFINELTASVISICWPFIACPPVWNESMHIRFPMPCVYVYMYGTDHFQVLNEWHAVSRFCMNVIPLDVIPTLQFMILYECYTIGCHPNIAVYDFVWMVITPCKMSEFASWVGWDALTLNVGSWSDVW